MRSLILCFFCLLASSPAFAKIVTKTVEYKEGDTVLEGYLAYDDAKKGKRPGVLVVHEWTGLGDYVKKRSRMLAEKGYVALAADIYGKGVRPSRSEAGKVSSQYKNDRELMRRRVNAGLEVLKSQKMVDADRLGAIGYCFGGTTVLELARSGAAVDAVVSFHGGLDTPDPADAKDIKGSILVLHGADDPAVPDAQVAAFEKEMRDAGVDWQLVKYSKAVHAFTNPDAGNDPSKGAAYNERADKRSWEAMLDFFEESLKR